MFVVLQALQKLVAELFKSRRRLEAENLPLRHQLTIALRQGSPRLRLGGSDRALLMDDQCLAKLSWCGAGGSAGDHPALAPRRFQNVLALAIAS